MSWVWAHSGRWWRTGKHGVLQSMGLQRVGHDWVMNNNNITLHKTSKWIPAYQTGQWHPHSSTLTWKIPWMEEPGRLQSMWSRRVRHDWATSLSLFTLMHWRRKWQPTPVFLPGDSQGWGSLVGCHLSHRVGHDWSDLAAGNIFKENLWMSRWWKVGYLSLLLQILTGLVKINW